MKNPKYRQTLLPRLRLRLRTGQAMLFGASSSAAVSRVKSVEDRLVELGVTTAEELISVVFSKGIHQLAEELEVNSIDLRDYFSHVRKTAPKHSIGDFLRLKMDQYPFVWA